MFFRGRLSCAIAPRARRDEAHDKEIDTRPWKRRSRGNPGDSSQRAVALAARLAQLLAPIALYPDELLADVLMAATYPLDVVEAA